MIYTVTLNPSLDYMMTVENFQLSKTNRSSREKILAGGKGINVSMVLKHLGVESRALGFLAGFVGKEIENRLEAEGIQTDFVYLKEGCSRINVKLQNLEGTEINAQGPVIGQEDLQAFMNRLSCLLPGDYLVLAGSIPPSLPKNTYGLMMETWRDRGVRVVLDATGEALRQGLGKSPFLIKPNRDELGDLFDVTIETEDQALFYAQKLRQEGAQNVLVSLGGKGALLMSDSGKIYRGGCPRGQVKNAVGAGDSMIAGFLRAKTQGLGDREALAMGIATGSASAFSDRLAEETQVEKLLPEIEIREVTWKKKS
ncbi:MAG: 1-phosphofructokinase [Eubacterium sp.]|nr:1-phosphofructokinase [Eubacterium sp.]